MEVTGNSRQKHSLKSGRAGGGGLCFLLHSSLKSSGGPLDWRFRSAGVTETSGKHRTQVSGYELTPGTRSSKAGMSRSRLVPEEEEEPLLRSSSQGSGMEAGNGAWEGLKA